MPEKAKLKPPFRKQQPVFMVTQGRLRIPAKEGCIKKITDSKSPDFFAIVRNIYPD